MFVVAVIGLLQSIAFVLVGLWPGVNTYLSMFQISYTEDGRMAVRPFVLCLLAVAARVISAKPEDIKEVCTEEKLVEFSPGAFLHLVAHGLSSRHTATVWTKHTGDEGIHYSFLF